jgi:hypothetical protein
MDLLPAVPVVSLISPGLSSDDGQASGFQYPNRLQLKKNHEI